MHFSDVECGKRLFVGTGRPIALGTGGDEIRGSAYIEGPIQTGTADAYSSVLGTVMIARDKNTDNKNQPPRSLFVKGNVAIDADSGTSQGLQIWAGTSVGLKINGSPRPVDINDGTVWIDAAGEAYFATGTGGKTMSARFSESDGKPKPFDIQHPTKGEGHRLRYACIEGPEVGVYYRGRLKNDTEIVLPYYWKDLVHADSITVQLQPIGAHQDIIVKRWDAEKIYLQAKPGFPINCFYHVYAERKDINPLITEYEGNECFDYPDPNYKPGVKNPIWNDPAFSGPPNTVTM